MRAPYLKEYNTVIPQDGKLVTIRAFVILDSTGTILYGPVEEQEDAQARLAALAHQSKVEQFIRETSKAELDDKAVKRKAKPILEYLSWSAAPRAAVVQEGEQVAVKETPAGAPAADESTLDNKEEF